MKVKIIFGLISTMSSGVRKTHAPILRAMEMQYLALLNLSSSFAPGVTISQSTAFGATAAHRSIRNAPVLRLLSERLRICVALPDCATVLLAHCTIWSSVIEVPSPLRFLSMSRVNWRMSCHIIARMSFLFPSAMSTPPMLTSTRSIFRPRSTTVLQLSIWWWRILGFLCTFFQFTPASIRSITWSSGRPLQRSANRLST
mmetsp:Transcript_402/g.1006  ORF Transcript_402/g.1006 Transcript_402/m.1006 type:complete len:200 (-) Transcript_402:302-901(-)